MSVARLDCLLRLTEDLVTPVSSVLSVGVHISLNAIEGSQTLL